MKTEIVNFFAFLYIYCGGAMQIFALCSSIWKYKIAPVKYIALMFFLNFCAVFFGIQVNNKKYIVICIIVATLYLIWLFMNIFKQNSDND